MNEQNTETITDIAPEVGIDELLETPLEGHENKKEEADVKDTVETETEDKTEEEVPELESKEDDVKEKPKKKVSGFERRRRRDRAKIEALEKELANKNQASPEKKQPETQGPPNPEDYEHGINDINYVNDLAEHTGAAAGKKAYAEAKQADQVVQAQNEAQKIDTDYFEKLDDAHTAHDDFEKVYQDNYVQLSDAALHALKKHKNAGELTYQILKDRNLGAKLEGMDAISQVVAIGEMGAKIKPAKQKKKVSGFTKPIEPVGSGKSNNKLEYSNDWDQATFNKERPIEDIL
ncbi:MAG: hypothetical protein GY861_14685 [bacterium]|nr:hypothetical protein [bacterium]